ncbi:MULTISPECIES: excalibur calcium-binding domain-containing protein [unclassified Shinella]|uniref:excalibur calcium-binding domain-containing protein n=1 Tax=unclassified Shinella TaxID=2643062 RepID=UPI00225C9AF3|nr:excalibur calcium-binding domain-containing protein [Shinella sp. YE25]MDC7254368.1 excalibur calcium-binding domain-containing protein [Shinella sp. YE25]CAI0337058.1 exported hypothetical protein [Rhizobiaceae bacterium]
MKLIIATITTLVVFTSAAGHAQSCKAAKTCAEAIEMWCEGYSGADRDDDGIPCENVCKSKKRVDALKKEIEACE